MKYRIIISFIVAAAFQTACTVSDVTYEAAEEIGFAPQNGYMTKLAAVNGEVYPTTLNMYIFAETDENTSATADYIDNGEFAYKFRQDAEKNEWGGWDSNTNQYVVYPWPSSHRLHFAGYSKSGNIADGATAKYDCSTDKLTITGYTPGTGNGLAGDNDLMYFPSTKATKSGGYTYADGSVPVQMLHTCSWLTFKVKGDGVSTGLKDSKYKVTYLNIVGIKQTGNLTADRTSISWVPTGEQSNLPVLTNGEVSLSNTVNDSMAMVAEDIENNTIVIPQKPGKLEIKYHTGISEETRLGDKALDLKLTDDPDDSKNFWEPGKHYTYTITIKANNIQIAPSPVDWISGDQNITVE